nr:response regulator transcription factor [Saccharothrix mutabilis subsp. capreolus]
MQNAFLTGTTRLVIAEHRTLFRIGMRKVLDDATGIEVVHQVDTYDALVRHAAEQPDVVVIGALADVPRPPVAARRFLDSRTSDRTGVLVVDDRAVLPAAPRVGVLPPAAGPDEFLSAIRMLAAGYAFFARAEPADPVEAHGPEQITRREADVLRLLVSGQTNSEMARKLSLTESTVKFHVQNLLRKLRLPNRASAVAYAYETGLISVGESATRARRP